MDHEARELNPWIRGLFVAGGFVGLCLVVVSGLGFYSGISTDLAWRAGPLAALGVVGILAGLFAAMWLSTLLHEGGHAIAARLVGFQVDEFVVWPLKWGRDHAPATGWRTPQPNRTWPRAAGYVSAAPTDIQAWSAKREAFYLFGGMLANAIVFGACVWMAFHINQRLIWFGALSLMALLQSAVPNATSQNDGWLLRELWRNPTQARSAAAYRRLCFLHASRVADIPEGLIDAALKYEGSVRVQTWLRIFALQLAKSRMRTQILVRDCVAFIDSHRSDEASKRELSALQVTGALSALLSLYQPETARRLLPAESDLNPTSEHYFRYVLACIQTAEGNPVDAELRKQIEGHLDGKELARFLNHIDVWCPLMRCASSFVAEVHAVTRPRELTADAIEELAACTNPPDARTLAHSWTSAYFIDSGRDNEAAKEIKRALALVEEGECMNAVLCEDARIEASFLAALVDRDLKSAERHLPAKAQIPSERGCWLRASAAIEMLRGRVVEANARISEAEALLGGQSALRQFERDLLERVRQIKPLNANGA